MAWVFRWIFTILLQTLFPPYLLSQVKPIMTDGCPQEFMQIDMATEIHFKNAFRRRCGIHLVQMGSTHHVIKKNCYPSSVGVYYDNVCNHLKAWIYSWMKRSFETRKECLDSKLLFKKFLNTKQIKSKLGKAFIYSEQSFITNHIETHESYFCFYLRYNLKHYEEYTNSIHEEMNHALKYYSAPVGPSTNIEKSLAIMCNNAERTEKISKVAYLDFCGTKIYSKLICANNFVPMDEAIMLDNWCRKNSKRLKTSTWLVTYNFDSEKIKQSKILYELPQCERVQQVKITDGFMCCSCNFWNRFGINCPHVYHVVSQSREFKEPGHRHISVRWWDFFYQFACISMNGKQFEALEKAMKILQINEKDSLPIETKWFNHLPTNDGQDLLTDFLTYDQRQYINYRFLNVELKELDHFKNYRFTTNFSQEIQKYDKLTISLKKIFLTTY